MGKPHRPALGSRVPKRHSGLPVPLTGQERQNQAATLEHPLSRAPCRKALTSMNLLTSAGSEVLSPHFPVERTGTGVLCLLKRGGVGI